MNFISTKSHLHTFYFEQFNFKKNLNKKPKITEKARVTKNKI